MLKSTNLIAAYNSYQIVSAEFLQRSHILASGSFRWKIGALPFIFVISWSFDKVSISFCSELLFNHRVCKIIVCQFSFQEPLFETFRVPVKLFKFVCVVDIVEHWMFLRPLCNTTHKVVNLLLHLTDRWKPGFWVIDNIFKPL